MKRIFVLICCLVLTAGCSLENDELIGAQAPELETVEQPIYNGTDDTIHPAVVAVGPLGCTGTFIAPNFIVTAQHCLPDCTQVANHPWSVFMGCYDGSAGPPWHSGSRSGYISTTARDGLLRNTGNSYNIDFLFVPEGDVASEWPYGTPDVAIYHTSDAFTGEPIPLMGPDNMPSHSNITSYTNTEVVMVGYSYNDGHNDARRRYASAEVTGIDNFQYARSFEVDGSDYNSTICAGDSGGPLLFTNAYGDEEVGGVVSQGFNCNPGPTTSSPLGYESEYAYIPRDFIDQVMCGDGWEYLGAHSHNAAAASDEELIRISSDGRVCRADLGTAASAQVVVLRDDPSHQIAEYNGSSESWRLIDANSLSREIAVTASSVYQRHSNGTVWVWDGHYQGWTRIDASIDPGRRLAANSNRVFQIESDGEIWGLYDYWGYQTWFSLDNNPYSTAIDAGDFGLFQLHGANGRLWWYTGSTPPWRMVDQDSNLVDFTVGDNRVYTLYNSGSLWAFDGIWHYLDDNAHTGLIVARGNQIYQMHLTGPTEGDVFRYNGAGFRHWDNLGGGSHQAEAIYGSVGTLMGGNLLPSPQLNPVNP